MESGETRCSKHSRPEATYEEVSRKSLIKQSVIFCLEARASRVLLAQKVEQSLSQGRMVLAAEVSAFVWTVGSVAGAEVAGWKW